MIASDPASRLARLRLSLDGLSIGDGFGEPFFLPGLGVRLIKRLAPDGSPSAGTLHPGDLRSARPRPRASRSAPAPDGAAKLLAALG